MSRFRSYLWLAVLGFPALITAAIAQPQRELSPTGPYSGPPPKEYTGPYVAPPSGPPTWQCGPGGCGTPRARPGEGVIEHRTSRQRGATRSYQRLDTRVIVGQIHERCLFRWDDSHQFHSSRTELRNVYNSKTVVTWKKIEHCIRLRAFGPIDAGELGKKIVNECVNKALNARKTRRIIQTLAALVADVYAAGGGTYSAANAIEYATTVADETLDCLTDEANLEEILEEKIRDSFNATIERESRWIYWDS